MRRLLMSDRDMPNLELVKDRPDCQIAFEVLERLLDRHQQQIMAPQLGRVLFDEIRAQQVPAFAQSCLPRLHGSCARQIVLYSGCPDHRAPPPSLLLGSPLSSTPIGRTGHAASFNQASTTSCTARHPPTARGT